MLCSKVSEILGSDSQHQNVFDISWTYWDLGMLVGVNEIFSDICDYGMFVCVRNF